jgi:hypothetical protein
MMGMGALGMGRRKRCGGRRRGKEGFCVQGGEIM